MKTIFYPLVFCSFCSLSCFSQISTPVVWLRGDSINSSIKTWPDYSGSKNNAVFSKDSFKVVKGIFNYNPAVRLDTNYFRVPYHQIKTTPELTTITVFYSADTIERGIWGVDNLCSRPSGQTTRRVLGPNLSFDPYLKSEGRAILNRLIQKWEPGFDMTPDSSMLIIGTLAPKQDSIPAFKGYLAECMIFDKILQGVEQAQIETYLAIKYGIQLEVGNYVSSDKTILWNSKSDTLYSHHITGLGRDDYFHLYQKQSRSASENGFLVIGAGKIVESNQKNAYTLNDKDFLVWGDNSGALSASGKDKSKILPLDRKWRMKVSGTASAIKTELRVNRKRLAVRDSVYWLIIDRSNDGNFSNVIYLKNDSIISDSIVVFKNICWDTDKSGMDHFSFGTSNKLTLKATVVRNPLCPWSDEGKLRLNITGGHPPYQYSLVQKTDTIQKWPASADSTLKSGIKGGDYRILVKDIFGLTDIATVHLITPDSLHLDLGKDQVLAHGKTFEKDLSKQVPDSTHVTWLFESRNAGQTGTSPHIKAAVPDLYTLTVTTDSGCVYHNKINLTAGDVKRFEVIPTLSDGNIDIYLSFNSQTDVLLTLMGYDGMKYWSIQAAGETDYHFSQIIKNSGAYYLTLQTGHTLETRRIIVTK
jgi:hypothetical protein